MHTFIAYLKNQSLYFYIFIPVVMVLLSSFISFLMGDNENASILFKYTLVAGSIPVWYSLLRDFTRGSFGVDIIAGVALFGTFITEEYLAGVVVLLMLSGGQLFEVYAMARARKELSALLSRTPLYAHVKEGEHLQDTLVSEIVPGMNVVIKPGEVVSVDGVIVEGETTVDESTLTGESIPVQRQQGMSVYAGTENIDNVIVVRVEKYAHETRYQSIVTLVEQAENSKAPIVRLADRYSLYFTGITFIIGLIAWGISHDLMRVVAVLVVATPCPLLLATPIAIMSGMSKASKKGVIVKDGGALETLSRTHTFVFDKTGTITLGTPEVAKVVAFGESTEKNILTIAASLDQLSTHILARALLFYAKGAKITLEYPEKFKEHFGDGIQGDLHGETYFFGKKTFVEGISRTHKKEVEAVYKEALQNGMIVVFLANKHAVMGALFFQDTLRREAGKLFLQLRAEGVKKTVILTGDKNERAHAVAKILHVTDVISECLPDEKVQHIQMLQKSGRLVAMVGDGVNDAPALACADVGMALGTHGQTASSDVADIVILSRSITRVYDVLHIAKKTIVLAKQGIFFGIGASTVAMVFSALGYIPPLSGILLQEGIDIVVIVNALRLGSILRDNA